MTIPILIIFLLVLWIIVALFLLNVKSDVGVVGFLMIIAVIIWIVISVWIAAPIMVNYLQDFLNTVFHV